LGEFFFQSSGHTDQRCQMKRNENITKEKRAKIMKLRI
jgi:hypothetical protein